MNDREVIYRRMILSQRRGYIQAGRPWPGKPDAAGAVTQYPNLLAELDASGETLDNLAAYARVSPEIMAAVLEDGESLSEKELRRLAYRLRVDQGYLSASVLQVVDPATDRGRIRIQRLKELFDQVHYPKAAEAPGAKRTMETLEGGKPVTYAAYRWAFQLMEEAIKRANREKAKSKRVRTVRRTSCAGNGFPDTTTRAGGPVQDALGAHARVRTKERRK